MTRGKSFLKMPAMANEQTYYLSGESPNQQIEQLKKQFYLKRAKEIRITVFIFLFLSVGSMIMDLLANYDNLYSRQSLSLEIGSNLGIFIPNFLSFFIVEYEVSLTIISFNLLIIKKSTEMSMMVQEQFREEERFADEGKAFIIHVMAVLCMVTYNLIYCE
jgi:hypothetical protein